MNYTILKHKTEEFILEYNKQTQTKLLKLPMWKVDSLLNNQDLDYNEKIEWLVNNNENPFYKKVKELLQYIICGNTNDIKNSIAYLANGKFLDSIGIPEQNNNDNSNLIDSFLKEIDCFKENSINKIIEFENGNKAIFVIDNNGDNFLTFNHCVEFIQENFETKTVDLYPGGWNTSKFVFKYIEVELTLMFDDFGGTDLRVDRDITKLKKDEIRQLVLSTILNLEGKILTK